MASFMSMHYDSDSDSADDLDFEPASDGCSGSGKRSYTLHKNVILLCPSLSFPTSNIYPLNGPRFLFLFFLWHNLAHTPLLALVSMPTKK